uniref:Protection of telomeres protein 1 ssDNA-binding domain-containing protein n=1 Tax=Globodera rostochiensis TaxID=31243 RepID=A0A914HBE4_GLORO
MIERNRYYYTKLGDLKIKDNVSVWAVVAFISHAGAEIKMMLLDECESPVFCVLGMDKCSNFGSIPLSNSMIVRIHRCRVRIASNNQVTIIGRINCAGLHVVAWCVDDLDCSTRYNSSNGFTFDPQLDAQRLDELRRYWKARIVDDGMARKLFFGMVNHSQLFTRERLANDAGITEQLRQPSEVFQNSFDLFACNAIKGNATDNNNEQHSANCDQNQMNVLEAEDAFLGKLKEIIRKITCESTCISFSRVRPNCYFDVVCQIVAVHVPFEGFGGATYLSVCDGTKSQIDGNFYCVGGTHTTQSQMFSDSEHIKDFVYVIGCWDDYAEKAKKFEAGDIVRILNAKVGPKDANGQFHLSLHGHTANSVKYKRGIECVRKAKRRPSDRCAEDGATEAESNAHPSGKRTRQREDGGD